MRFRSGILLLPLQEIIRGLFDPLAMKHRSSLAGIFLPLLLVVAIAWFVTVPVHELLHALGCLMSGGSVHELTIQRLYGGAVLERLIPFVRAGGTYAGQLSDFDTGESDICYFITVLFPYILTVFFGIPMLALARRSGNPLPHGIGIVHSLLPLVSVTGDYYEMGSIAATRIAGFVPGSREAELIRGDDLAIVVTRVTESNMAGGFLLIGFSLLLAVLFIWATWWCSLVCSRVIARKALEKGKSGEYS